MDLRLDNVRVVFGEAEALAGISLEVASGERVAVIGSSGAGKSTLFRTLTRSVPASGRVFVGGRDLYSLSKRELSASRRNIGTIRQSYDLVPQLSAAMNVALGEVGQMSGTGSLAAFLRGPRRETSEHVMEALARVGLSEKARSRAGNLSGGQQQRVAVARLLVQRPGLVLADEPLSAVDPVTAGRVMDALLAMNRERGATLVMNLHDVTVARTFPRTIALKNGRVAYDGSPEDLTEGELRRIYAGDDSRTRSRGNPDGRSHIPNPVTGGMDGISAR